MFELNLNNMIALGFCCPLLIDCIVEDLSVVLYLSLSLIKSRVFKISEFLSPSYTIILRIGVGILGDCCSVVDFLLL